MNSTINQLNQQNIAISAVSGKLTAWKPGQVLYATVIKHLPDQTSLLKIGDSIVQTKLDAKIQAGSKLVLEVVTSGKQTILQIRTQTERTQQLRALINAAIKQYASQQNSITALLNTVYSLDKLPSLKQSLPANIQQLLTKLLEQVPGVKQISSRQGLKNAIQQSGLWLERKGLVALKHPSSVLEQLLNKDFKGLLLKLKAQLQSLQNNPITPAVQNGNKALYKGLVSALNVHSDSTGIKYSSASVLLNVNKTGLTTNSLQATLASAAGGKLFVKPDSGQLTFVFPQSRTGGLNTSNHSTPSSATALPGHYQTLVSNYTALSNEQRSIKLPGLRPPLRDLMPHPVGSHISFFQPGALSIADSNKNLFDLLIKLVESALARINIAQLNSTSPEPDNKQIWLFDLPISRQQKEAELVQFKIEADNNTEQHGDKRSWTVSLALDLPGLGPIQSTISLTDDKVITHFYTSNEQQQAMIQSNLNLLQERLVAVGLQVQGLFSTQGLVDQPLPEYLQQLLDETA